MSVVSWGGASLDQAERLLGMGLPREFKRTMTTLPLHRWIPWLYPVSSWTTVATELDRDQIIELDVKLSCTRGIVIGGDDGGDVACLLQRHGELAETVWWWNHGRRRFERLAPSIAQLPEVLEHRAAVLLGQPTLERSPDPGDATEQVPQ